MMIKTPKFWLKKNLISLCLWPLSLVYRAMFFFSHHFKKQSKSSLPIICVGNVVAGGSGKTPTVMALGRILQKRNVDYAFLSRGYGGREENIRLIDDSCNFQDVGDEPLLLAFQAPTFMAKNRVDGVKFIEQTEKFRAIILDDGMQNARLKKDLLLMVVDGKIKFGNGFQIPAGPLRQSVASGIEMADLIVVAGEIDDELRQILSPKKDLVIQAKIQPLNLESFKNLDLLAFCGLAYPEKFFSYLEKNGLHVKQKKSFPDHFSYQKSDLQNLVDSAQNKGLKLVTTKKDWIKFGDEFKNKIEFLDIEFVFDKEDLIAQKIGEILQKKKC